MENKWKDSAAKAAIEQYSEVHEDIALRVYTSRLIGADPSLVLHGGGNTSVKSRTKNKVNEEVDVLYVKGSGWDLDTLAPPGLPGVLLDHLVKLRDLDSLSDEDMVNEQRTHLLDSSSPNPSVETLLHAFLPHKFIDHSHADASLIIANQPDAEKICREIFGDTIGMVSYIMPGFALAKAAAEVYEKNPKVEGLMLINHGLFTFGATAKETLSSDTGARAGNVASDTEIAAVGYGSIFFEKEFGMFTVGVDYVPTPFESDSVETRKMDQQTEASDAVSSVENKVQVDLEDLYSVYVAMNITENSYVKAGVTSVDVITNESMGTGSAYGNTSLDGTLVGVGINNELDNGIFWRVEGVYMNFDGVSLTSGDNTINLKSLDGVNGTLSIGKSF